MLSLHGLSVQAQAFLNLDNIQNKPSNFRLAVSVKGSIKEAGPISAQTTVAPNFGPGWLGPCTGAVRVEGEALGRGNDRFDTLQSHRHIAVPQVRK